MRRLALLCTALAAPALAGEGKWMPQQVLDLGPRWVKAQGFGVPLQKLWDAKAGTGLLANAVQLPGCSGAFVSAEGLLITNHHCVVGILQEHSTPQANLGRDGYLAATRDDEKPARAFRVQVPQAFRDVTAEVRAALPSTTDDLARFRALEAVEKRLVAACEQPPHTRCQFAAFEGGLSFTLTTFHELTDLRLVWAPPVAVGDYGGEIDNWTWPRHTGDFALLRAWEDGRPYQPKVWFPVSTQGVQPEDAVAVLGYPGRSWRSWLADEMAERQERYFPQSQALSAEWIAVLEAAGAKDPAVAITVSDELRGLLNRRKNAEGQLAGLARGHIVETQRQAENAVLAKLPASKDGLAAREAHARLLALHQERLATWDRDFLLDALAWGPRALRWPTTLVRRATEAVKPDLEREPGTMERDLPRLRERLERDQKRYAPAVDEQLLVSWVTRALALPPGQRIAAVDQTFAHAQDPAALLSRLRTLVAGSQVFDAPARLAMFDERPQALAARKDPLLELGFALDTELRALKDRRDRLSGAALVFRPTWRRAVLAAAGHPIAPDANGTLRVTFGHVRGYAPRDAVTYGPQTTLTGAVAKHTGKEPFDLPAFVRDAHASGKLGAWKDARLGDVPVDFLSDCDTTGGNSGSPTIDGQGRLVGVNFDRVWENVANDFGYVPAVARNVNADARYLWWLLSLEPRAAALRAELGAR